MPMIDLDFLPDADEQAGTAQVPEPTDITPPTEDLSFLPDAADLTHSKAEENLNVVEDLDPDAEAKVFNLARQSGLTPELVRSAPQDVEKMVKQVRPDLWHLRQVSPKAAEYYAKSIENAAISKDDHEGLSYVEQLWNKAKTSWSVGRQNVALGKLRSKQLLGDESDETQALVDDLKARQIHSVEDENWLESMVTGAGEMLPIIVDTTASGQESGLAYSMAFATGAALIGQAGPQALAPEEVVTVPAAAVTGYLAGVRVGSAKAMFQLEAGLAYDEFLGVKDENGQTLDKNVARVAAAGVGAINAGLEFTGAKYILRTIPGGEKLLGRLTTSSVARALRSESVRNALAAVAARYAGAITVESLTEMGQEAVTILGGELAKAAAEEKDDTYFTGQDPEEAMERILESGREAAAATMALGIPGSVVSASVKINEVKKNQDFRETQDTLNTAIQQTKTKERSPEKMEDFLDTVGLGEDVFITPDGVTEYFQTDPTAAAELLERLGLDPEKVKREAAQGLDTKVKLSKLHAHLTPEEFQAVLPDVKAAPSAMSTREVQALDLSGELDRVSQAYREAVDNNDAYQAELSRVRQEVTDAGFDDDYADTYVDTLNRYAARMAVGGREKVDFVKKITIARRQSTNEENVRQAAIAEDEIIGGVTRSELSDMLAAGDENAIAHILEGIRQHGLLQVQDAVRNDMMVAVAKTPKDNRPAVIDRLKAITPLVDAVLASTELDQPIREWSILDHYTAADIAVAEPAFQGTGLPGREFTEPGSAQRPRRIHYYEAGVAPERQFSSFQRYRAFTDRALYNIAEDPNGYGRRFTVFEYPDTQERLNAIERKAIEDGYAGLRSDDVTVLFEAVPVHKMQRYSLSLSPATAEGAPNMIQAEADLRAVLEHPLIDIVRITPAEGRWKGGKELAFDAEVEAGDVEVLRGRVAQFLKQYKQYEGYVSEVTQEGGLSAEQAPSYILHVDANITELDLDRITNMFADNGIGGWKYVPADGALVLHHIQKYMSASEFESSAAKCVDGLRAMFGETVVSERRASFTHSILENDWAADASGAGYNMDIQAGEDRDIKLGLPKNARIVQGGNRDAGQRVRQVPGIYGLPVKKAEAPVAKEPETIHPDLLKWNTIESIQKWLTEGRVLPKGLTLEKIKEVSKPRTPEKLGLGKEYFQSAMTDVPSLPISLAIFKSPMLAKMRGRVVKRGTIDQVLKQKDTKQIEKDIVNEILSRAPFAGAKSFSFDEFRLAVEQELMPLEVIATGKYADYGARSIGFRAESYETVLYNTPVEHGYEGHFRGLFGGLRDAAAINYEILRIPDRDIWVALDQDRPAGITGEALEAFVGTAGSREAVEAWVASQKNREVRSGKSGLFGHVRRWDTAEMQRFLPEIQSDFYQKNDPKSVLNDVLFKAPRTKAQEELAKELQDLRRKHTLIPDSIEMAVAEGTAMADTIRRHEALFARYEEHEATATYHIKDRPPIYVGGDIVAEYPLSPGEMEVVTHDGMPGVAFLVHPKLSDGPDAKKRWAVSEAETGFRIHTGQHPTKEEAVRAIEDFVSRKTQAEVAEIINTAREAQSKMNIYPVTDILKHDIRRRKTDLEIHVDRAGRAQYEHLLEINRRIKYIESKGFEEEFGLTEKQFVAHRKNYVERMLREEIRSAAKSGIDSLYTPLPYTLAVIEGYIDAISEESDFEIVYAEDEENLDIGDNINYGGTEYTVVTSDQYEFSAVPTDQLIVSNLDSMYSDLVDEEVEQVVDSLPSDFLYGELNDHINPTDFFTDHVNGEDIIRIIKEYYESWAEETGDATIEELDSEPVNAEDFTDLIESHIRDNTYSVLEYVSERLDEHFQVDQAGVIYTYDEADTIILDQPDHDRQRMTESNFEISKLDEKYQGIAKRYEEIGNMLKRLKPDSFSIEHDAEGFPWYSVAISSEDAKEPVYLFQENRGSVQITNDQYIISLFDGADLSTLLHETGHIFLEELTSVVKSGQATLEIRRDFRKIQKWLGADTEDFTREQHEQFARGFEAYLRDGKAPDTELETAFARFKRWLTSVYQSARALNVKLNAEVRGVFDRMLMADASVQSTIDTYDLANWGKEQLDALGVVPEDKAYLQRLMKKMQEKAEVQMVRAMNKSRRANAKEWRQQAQEELESQPIYQAVQTLVDGAGLDAALMREAYGEDITDALPKTRPSIMRETGGLSPEMAAMSTGYDSADDLINDLMQFVPLKQAVEQRVDELRLAHDSQFKASDYLVGSPEFTEYLAVIAKYIDGAATGQAAQLQERLRTPGSSRPTVSKHAFVQYARRVVTEMSIREASRHDRFLSAIRKYTGDERRAVLRGDYPAASKANEKVRLNYEFAGQAVKVRKEVEKLQARLKRIAKSKSIDNDYMQNILAIADRFKLGTASMVPTRIEEAAPLAELVQGDGEFNDGFPASDWLLQQSFIKDFRDLSVAQFRELANLISYLEGQGRDTKKGRLLTQKMTVEQAALEAQAEMQELPVKAVREKYGVFRRMSDVARRYFAMQDSLQFILISLGGYKNLGKKGVVSRVEQLILEPLIAAQNEETVLWDKVYKSAWPHVLQLMKASNRWRKKYGTKMRIEGAEVPALLKADGQNGWWTGEQVMALALNMGNEGNRSRLYSGYPDLTEDTVARLLDILTKEDWDAIQGIWDTINSLYPKLDATHFAMNNFHMDKVEPSPVRTKYGTYRGGYYPIRFDTRLTRKKSAQRVEEFTERDDLMARSEAIRQVPASRSGFTKKRAGGASIPIKLSVSVATEHLRDTVHYITHAQAVRDADRITRHEIFAEEAKKVLGEHTYNMIRPALKYIARPERDTNTDFDRAVDWLRGKTTAFILAWNLGVAIKQVFSAPSAIYDNGLKAYLRGWSVMFTKSPYTRYQEMIALSPYLSQRATGMDRELQAMFRKMSPTQRALFFGDKALTWEDVRNSGFWLIRLADMLAVMPIWHGAYLEAVDKNGGNVEAAVAHADNIVRKTQPSAQPLDLSQWQRAGGAIRLFSSFQTYTVGKYGQRQRLHYRAWRAGKLSTADYAFFNLMDAVIPAVSMNLLFAFLHGEDLGDEDTKKGLLSSIMAYIITTGLPIINALWSPYGGPLDSPLAAGPDEIKRALENGTELIENFSDEAMEKVLWSIAHVMSFLSGVPVSRVVKKAVKGHEQDEGGPIKYLVPAPRGK